MAAGTADGMAPGTVAGAAAGLAAGTATGTAAPWPGGLASGMRSTHAPRWLLPAVLLLAAAAPTSAAQRVGFSVGAVAAADGSAAPSFGVRFEGVKVEGGTVTLEVRHAGTAQLGFGVTTSRAFGPLGNVVVDAWGALRVGGGAEARIGARGVLGPVAVRLALVGFGAAPGTFRPDALASAERPVLPGPAFGVQAGLTWRPSRNVVLELDPEVYLAGGVALRGEGRVRFLRLLGDDELFGVALAYAPPGLGTVDGAVGVGMTLTRGRAPDWTFTALVGASPAGFGVGGRATLAEDLGPVRVVLDAAFEPYRLDLAPLRMRVAGSAPSALGGTWEVTASLASDLGAVSPHRAAQGTSYAVTATLSLPFEAPR